MLGDRHGEKVIDVAFEPSILTENGDRKLLPRIVLNLSDLFLKFLMQKTI